MKSKVVEIEYDEKRLHAQLPAIRESQVEAWKNLCRRAYIKAKGLRLDDAPEIWEFALGGKTFRECAQSLIMRITDEAELEKTFRRLSGISELGPMTEADFESGSDRSDLFLVQNWTWLKARDKAHPNETNPILAKLLFHRDEETLEITRNSFMAVFAYALTTQ